MSNDEKDNKGPEGFSRFDTEVWKADFTQNCLDIFGAPVSLNDCLGKEDSYYFSYCMVCLAIAMKQYKGVWSSYMDLGMDAEAAAYSFAEHYEVENGETLIPLYKGAQPDFEGPIPGDM